MVENLIDDFTTDGVVDYEKFKALQLTKEGVEGWIVQTDDGDMWKVKTKWYCDLHHSVTFTRWRDVARAVLADQSDDLKAAFATPVPNPPRATARNPARARRTRWCVIQAL